VHRIRVLKIETNNATLRTCNNPIVREISWPVELFKDESVQWISLKRRHMCSLV
jgi:hypothetical protein